MFFLGALAAFCNLCAAAQSPPWHPFICGAPTIPHYLQCAGHASVNPDIFPFSVGCYDVQTGESLDCHNDSTLTVPPGDALDLTGGHLHPRDASHLEASMGGFWYDYMGSNAPPVLSADMWTNYRWVQAYAAMPEAAGTMLFFQRWVAPPNYVCVADRIWQLDPTDPSCRTCYATFMIGALVEGLQLLPDNDALYVKNSDPHAHAAGQQFYGTPQMIQKLTELAQQYQDWYYQANGVTVKISFNDLSLIYGGLYDYGGNWDCPHTLHRLGRSADVNHGQVGSAEDVDDDRLDTLANNLGLTRYEKRIGNIHYELK